MGEWKDKGQVPNIVDILLPSSTSIHEVESADTGELRRVYVHGTQTVDEAITNAQWVDDV
jgi:hypothetical protein